MAVRIPSLIAEIELDLRDFEAGMKKLGQSVKAAGKQIVSLGDKASRSLSGLNENLSGKLATAAKVGVASISAFGVASIAAASAAEEAGAKFDTVFKRVGTEVKANVDAFAASAGRSKFELRAMAATLGDVLKPLGFAERDAGTLSVQLTKLAADLGSFNDMPMDEALQRLRGTLVGSHENALAFGVVINENVLKAELLRNGWDKLTGTAKEQAKVQARINLLMAGTTDAQGDAIRTSGSFANQLKALKSEMQDVSVELGTELLPAARAFVTYARATLVPTIKEIAQALKEFNAGDFTRVFVALREEAIETLKFLKQFTAIIPGAGPGIEKAISDIKAEIVELKEEGKETAATFKALTAQVRNLPSPKIDQAEIDKLKEYAATLKAVNFELLASHAPTAATTDAPIKIGGKVVFNEFEIDTTGFDAELDELSIAPIEIRIPVSPVAVTARGAAGGESKHRDSSALAETSREALLELAALQSAVDQLNRTQFEGVRLAMAEFGEFARREVKPIFEDFGDIAAGIGADFATGFSDATDAMKDLKLAIRELGRELVKLAAKKFLLKGLDFLLPGLGSLGSVTQSLPQIPAVQRLPAPAFSLAEPKIIPLVDFQGFHVEYQGWKINNNQ